MYTCSPVHLHTYTPEHLYTSTPVHLYTCTSVHLYMCIPPMGTPTGQKGAHLVELSGPVFLGHLDQLGLVVWQSGDEIKM